MMNKVGRRIYYDTSNGLIIFMIPEQIHYNDTVIQTIERDIEVFKPLSSRNPGSFSCLELDYGELSQDFNEGVLVGVDIETRECLFTYPGESTSEPDIPTVPISVQLADIKYKQSLIQSALDELIFFGGGM